MQQTRFNGATDTAEIMENKACSNESLSSSPASAATTTTSTAQPNSEANNTSARQSSSREVDSTPHVVDEYTTNLLEGDEAHKTASCKVDEQPQAEMTAPTNKEEKGDDDELPDERFLCPITHELMTDPVRSPYGHSYQRSAIIGWLYKNGGQNTCPMTRQPLGPWQLATDQNLRLEIRQWQIQRGVEEPIPMEAKSGEKHKEIFLLFVRVLLKHLEHTKSPLYVQVKNIIKEFRDRQSRGEPCYLVNMRRQIKAIVPERDWKMTEDYVRHILVVRRRKLSASP